MNILSIDGGGIRGLIPARVVEELERRVGAPLAARFDLVIGTSTGALVAAALTAPHIDGRPRDAAEIPLLYRQHGSRIFPMGRGELSLKEKFFGRRDMSLGDEMMATAQRFGSLFGGNPRFGGGARHQSHGVEDVLAAFFGDTQLSECLTGIRITTFDQTAGQAVVFSNDDPIAITDALRASVAAPTYLAPHRIGNRSLVDGGVWANNPALVALPELLVDPQAVLISIGTGHRHNRVPVHSAKSRNWLQQARDLLAMVTEGETNHHVLERAMSPDRYIRFQTVLPPSINMDDPSESNLDQLDRIAGDLVRVRAADLDRAARKLSGSRL